VKILAPCSNNKALPKNMSIIPLGATIPYPSNGSVARLTLSLWLMPKVKAIIEEEKFEILHFHEPLFPSLPWMVLPYSHSVNVATFHAYAGFSPSMELGRRILPGYAGRLHGRIAVSAAARHFADRFFPGDYKVIPNGVDLERFARAVPLSRWHDGTPNILFVGRLEDRKCLPFLLKAFRLIRKDGIDARLLIVGTGPQEREARRYVLTRGLQNVEFLGRVSDDDKAQLFRTATVFVSPATGRESFGIVLLEAMAAGAAVVCSDIHGYKGVIQRNRQGLLVQPRDVRGLAAAIEDVLADPALRARLSAAGRERAEQFGWEHVTQKVEDYYGFVIRRLAAQHQLPPGFSAAIPPAPHPSV